MTIILILLIGFSIVNLFFFAYVIFYNQLFILFLIWNVLSYFIYRKIYFKNFDQYQGLPVELYFFLPGIGGVLVSMTLFLLIYIKTDSLMIEDYENYIRFQNNRMNLEPFDYVTSIQTMSALDVMTYYGDDLKKEMIVNYKNEFKKERVELLRQGNLDEDTEVQHYAAVMLNTLENEINSDINALQARLKNSNNRQVLDQLLSLYKAYIDSSLLDEAAIKIYNSTYIELLERRIKAMEFSYDYAVDLYQAYFRQLSFKQARDIYELIKEKYGETPEMLLLKMNLDLKVADQKEITKTIEKMKEQYSDSQNNLTNKQESQMAFWIGKYGNEAIS